MTSQGSTPEKGKRTSYKKVQVTEDNIARQLAIIREAQAIMMTIDDPKVAKAVARRLARIIECAGETWHSLIDDRNGEAGEAE